MSRYQQLTSSLRPARRFAVLSALLLWALVACATTPAGTTVPDPTPSRTASPTPVATATARATAPATVAAASATPRPSPTLLPAPRVLTDDGCPPPGELYRNEVMGIAIPVAVGQRVAEPQYRSVDYGVSLIGPGELWPFQAIWLTQQTPEQLETVVAGQLAQLASLPTVRTPVVVAGVEGTMLSPVPGEVAHTAVYLPVDNRLFLLLYANETLDDAGRCLLAGLSFFAPTQSLAELDLPVDPGLPGATEPALPTATLPADPTTWAAYPQYHNATYGFSFRYPDERWTVIEPTAANPHRLSLAYHELGIALRIGVARSGEDAELQLYGGRAGDFVPLDDTLFLGEPISRSALVYQGVTWSVHYNDTRPIPRGDLRFSLALVSSRDFEQGATIPAEVVAEADRIVASFVLEGE